MNIYQKLAAARVKLSEGGLKKGATNDYTKNAYFELADFLPHITKLGHELGFVCIPSFCTDLASLLIVNTEKTDEVIEITSPMSTAELKGVHAVQNLGAVQTYLRRYLYIAAFEIVEADKLEANYGKPAPAASKASASPDIITTAQLKELVSMCGADTVPAVVARRKVLSDIRGRKGYKKASLIETKDYDAIAEELCIALANMEAKA